MLDARIAEPHREIGAALAGRYDGCREVHEMLEVHVPQPGQVFAVGNLAVHRNDRSRNITGDHRQRLLPPGGILGQQHAHAVLTDLQGPVPAGDLVDRRHRGHRGGRRRAQRDRGGHGLCRVAAVHRAGQGQRHGRGKAFRPIDVRLVVPPLGLRA